MRRYRFPLPTPPNDRTLGLVGRYILIEDRTLSMRPGYAAAGKQRDVAPPPLPPVTITERIGATAIQAPARELRSFILAGGWWEDDMTVSTNTETQAQDLHEPLA
jgi:hypothetical protein